MKKIKQCMTVVVCSILLSSCVGQAPEEPVKDAADEVSAIEVISDSAFEISSALDDAEASEEILDESSNKLTPNNIPEWSKAYSEYLRTGAEYISFADGDPI